MPWCTRTGPILSITILMLSSKINPWNHAMVHQNRTDTQYYNTDDVIKNQSMKSCHDAPEPDRYSVLQYWWCHQKSIHEIMPWCTRIGPILSITILMMSSKINPWNHAMMHQNRPDTQYYNTDDVIKNQSMKSCHDAPEPDRYSVLQYWWCHQKSIHEIMPWCTRTGPILSITILMMSSKINPWNHAMMHQNRTDTQYYNTDDVIKNQSMKSCHDAPEPGRYSVLQYWWCHQKSIHEIMPWCTRTGPILSITILMMSSKINPWNHAMMHQNRADAVITNHHPKRVY